MYAHPTLISQPIAEGRPLPGQPCPIDMPDDFFRVRLVCVLLDTCGMCFERGSQKKKLDNFLVFFQVCSNLFFLAYPVVALLERKCSLVLINWFGVLAICVYEGRVAYGC